MTPDDLRVRYVEALAEQVRDREAVGLDEALADMDAQLAGTEATDLRDWFECAYERSRLIAEAERYTVPDREALPPSACDTETLRSLRSTLRKSGLAQDRRAIDLEEQATGAVSNAPSDIVSHAGAVATSDARTKLRVRAATSAIESRASSQAEGELDLEAQLERLARGVQALGQDPADAAAACDVWVAHLALTFEIRFAKGQSARLSRSGRTHRPGDCPRPGPRPQRAPERLCPGVSGARRFHHGEHEPPGRRDGGCRSSGRFHGRRAG